ncbi:hypothetical protein [Maribacter sedimenticola]|nr:hypothetical protein [Maribacter sedimenticola]
MIKAIEKNAQERRKECLPAIQAWQIWMMERAIRKKSNVAKGQF